MSTASQASQPRGGVAGRKRAPAGTYSRYMGRSAGTVVYLHGVGGLREDWQRPLREAVGPAPGILAVEYADLLTAPTGMAHRVGRAAPLGDLGRGSRDPARAAYVERQRALARVLESSGEAIPPGTSWPAGLLRPGGLPDRLPLPQMMRAPVFGLDQVGRYLEEPACRDAVLSRVAAAMAAAAPPVVLIGHSLGSIVAADLIDHDDMRVELLVTLGSPLGHAAIEAGPAGSFPYGRIGGWLNVVHLLDPVPFGRGLSTRFPAALDAYLPVLASPRGIVSAMAGLARVATAHLESTYLSSQTVASAVRYGLSLPSSTAAHTGPAA